ncbi:MAG TPA: hypothetical protein VKZ68_09500 [Ohtaekwangia sp.]|nr:hypothetical protein [Ohtaekwangia sp.]
MASRSGADVLTGHPSAFLSTSPACLSTNTAVVFVVFSAFFGARLTDVGAWPAQQR